MNLQQQTVLDQIEIKCDASGNALFLFQQTKVSVIDADAGNAVIAGPTFDRSAMAANDPRAIALLGAVPAGALANLQSAQAAEQAAATAANQLQAQVLQLQGENAQLAAELAALRQSVPA